MCKTSKVCSKLALTLSLCVAASGASARSNSRAPQNTPAGNSEQTITVGGVQRTYIVHIPPSYDGATALPLVLVLHGKGSSGEAIAQSTGMSDKADKEKFVVAYPNAAGQLRRWNEGFNPSSNDSDDVEFLKALLEKLQHDLRIDSKRMYCCGFSSGAMMTYRIGSALSNTLAAIGVVSGSIGIKTNNGSVRMVPIPSHPFSAIVFHGKQDQQIYYDGGGMFANCLSVAQSIDFMLKANGCAAQPQETVEQAGNLIRDDYPKCKAGSEVVLITFVNGTHEWPKVQNNDSFSATDAMWEFFVKHSKP
jgi:polyhydroxybutyrate depolymerase